MSGGWSSEFYQHTAYLMAAARRKGKSPSPTILFGLLPHSGEPLSGGRLRLPQPHGTCSSVQPAVGGARPGLGAASPLIPPPDPQDLSLRGWGGREGGSPREAAAGERPRPSCSREEAGRGRGSGGRSRGGIALPQRRCLWSLRSGCTVIYPDRRWERAAKLWSVACYLWGRQQFWSSSFMGIILLLKSMKKTWSQSDKLLEEIGVC
ncbi:NF-kappa-B inhibitor-interacting Ras-like protein 1 isoform X1 [Canis lupus baileyi]|uniref:NF-kappa-B inhibitor-interacting Ras-like protein 1 isoform X1 n=1 Tax=Canis lupus familiaris TaxID=9615 RepID=UPI0015F13E72|nr:NF-kappa-B inhibitor-interacting Ras-like protein 1 isoform X1 [Canis lupus familiaris]XP_038288089.1 NF-kappa-B inhibitor-interacting Ras-like protein 1 isoform X1 [Canis lupus familiaris]XP_038426635.1 NF-kappa-B inhibitor-interacting Ras-like protein 1 isoform X1 [Canis lupus familiaris]